MIGLCGAASLGPDKRNGHAVDLMSQAFARDENRALRSVRWDLPSIACCLFYRASERLPEPDRGLESATDSQRALAFAFGKVCPPPEHACASKDPLLRARTCIETSYSQGGVESLAGINGNWVAAICDNENKAVVLSRDPVGIQMLYYAIQGATLYFATHLSALLKLGCGVELDRTGLGQFMHFLYIPSPRTAFEGVSCVPVGKAVIVNHEGVSFRPLRARGHDRYWKVRSDDRAEVSTVEAVNALDGMLTEAVRERTAAAGRTAIFLSGGKDSSSLCAAAAKVDPRKYLAVTVGFDDASVDESSDAAAVARHLGMDHIILKFTADEYMGALEDFSRVHGQPFGDPAGLPLYLAARHLPPDVEMVLDGTGNDAYMGIPLQRDEKIYLDVPPLRFFASLFPPSIARFLPRRVRRQLEWFRRPLRELFVKWNGWPENEVRSVLSLDPHLRDTEMNRLCNSFAGGDGVELKTEAICRIWEPDTAYRKAVQSANHLDLPISYPFADSRLASFFSTLPKVLCYRGRVNKVLLREYMSRYLPRQILAKPRGRFVFDQDVLLRSDDCATVRRYLGGEGGASTRAAYLAGAGAVVRRYIAGELAFREKVYALVLLNAWLAQLPNAAASAISGHTREVLRNRQ